MIIHHISKGTRVQPVLRLKEGFQSPGGLMRVGIFIYQPMQPDAMLDLIWKIELLFTFYVVADHIAHEYPGYIKGKICMGEVIHVQIKLWRKKILSACSPRRFN
jgi:hypothetical protein